MSDETKSLEILIKTTAELSGAKEAESQLERVAAQAAALNAAGHDAAAQRAIFENFSAPDGAERSAAAVSSGEAPRLALNSQRTADLTREKNQDLGGPAGPVEVEDRNSRDEAARPKIAAFDERSSAPESPDSESAGIAEKTPDETERARGEAAPPANAVPGETSPAKPGVEAARNWDSAGAAFAVPQSLERHAQALATAGEQLRQALEQNTAETVALLQRLINVAGEGQSRLGALARRVEELEGRVRDSMNR